MDLNGPFYPLSKQIMIYFGFVSPDFVSGETSWSWASPKGNTITIYGQWCSLSKISRKWLYTIFKANWIAFVTIRKRIQMWNRCTAANDNTENDRLSTTRFVFLQFLSDYNNLSLGFNSEQRKDRKHSLPQQKQTTLEKSAARLCSFFWGNFLRYEKLFFANYISRKCLVITTLN